MSDSNRNLKEKQRRARAHPVRARILKVIPKGEVPTAKLVREVLGEEFPDLTVELAHYHLGQLIDAQLLPGRRNRDTELAKGVAAAVQQTREEKGMSPEALAQGAEIPLTQLEAIETGTAEEFWGDLRRLAYGLEVHLNDLLERVEELAPPIEGSGRSRPSDEGDGNNGEARAQGS